MSDEAPVDTSSTTAVPDLSLLPEEGGAVDEGKRTTEARSTVGSVLLEEEEGEGASCSEWWEPFFCCGSVPGGGSFRTVGYEGDDSDDSDDEHEALRAEFSRCDFCGRVGNFHNNILLPRTHHSSPVWSM
jgi:hypothetical protein